MNCTDWYQVSEVDGTVVDVKYLGPICDYSGGNGTGPDAPPGAPAPGGGGNPAAPPKTDCTVPNSVKVKIQSTDGHLIVNKKDGGPITIGDGDGTFPPPTTTPPPKPVPCPTVYVINNVNDPCLKNMVKATISAGVTSQVNTLVQGVFGNSDKLNLTFVDVDTLKNYVDGQTKPNGFFDANGKLNITVLLNKNTMPHFSQQYVARVIMYEALHAYMIAKKIPPVEQHEDMAISYVTKMASSLQQLFPGLSDADAKNLSLGGLTQTTTFQNTIAKDMGLSGSFDATQSSYSIGSSGLRCN